ncbi:MAG TPA: hypothetical protein DCP11_10545 [Microbacteriaceae bacterium]|nr:hypothetical protein [Microbacteriaceae bacterium]
MTEEMTLSPLIGGVISSLSGAGELVGVGATLCVAPPLGASDGPGAGGVHAATSNRTGVSTATTAAVRAAVGRAI